MNLDMNPTKEELRVLLARCDDRAGNHLLWVKRNGEVEFTRLHRRVNLEDFQYGHPEMQLRYALFLAGLEYVGEDAAKDEDWVQELFDKLMTEWRAAKGLEELVCVEVQW